MYCSLVHRLDVQASARELSGSRDRSRLMLGTHHSRNSVPIVACAIGVSRRSAGPVVKNGPYLRSHSSRSRYRLSRYRSAASRLPPEQHCTVQPIVSNSRKLRGFMCSLPVAFTNCVAASGFGPVPGQSVCERSPKALILAILTPQSEGCLYLVPATVFLITQPDISATNRDSRFNHSFDAVNVRVRNGRT